MASPGANGTSASRVAGNWPRPRGASRRCPPAGVCCWRRSRRARWMMRQRSARRRWRKACCMRWWCWPIMRAGWWHPVHARDRDADGFVSTKVDTHQSRLWRRLERGAGHGAGWNPERIGIQSASWR
ncbi:hypothetical protein G6F21_014556 [Rhizopus arrhizus]|nr:hypothetical protein G6F21_014556 [Rhizopus arrhizus]